MQRGGIHRKPMAMLRKTRHLGAGTRTPMLLTKGDLDSVVGRFGSPSETKNELANGESSARRILPLLTRGWSFVSAAFAGSLKCAA